MNYNNLFAGNKDKFARINDQFGVINIKERLNDFRTDNEILLDNIIKILCNEYFSRVLESKYKNKYVYMQKIVKELENIDINSYIAEKLLIKVFRNLKSILNETHVKLNFHKQKKDEKLNGWFDIISQENIGLDIIFQDNPDLDIMFQSYLEFNLMENVVTKCEQIYLKLLSKAIKKDKNTIRSFNFEELKSIVIIKQNIDLEKIRGRAPGNLTYIS